MLTFVAIGLACAFFLPWQQAVAVGLILALSSTAIVLQTLREKGLMNTSPGKSIFSVLLFQDLAVIPILALLPLLATAVVHSNARHGSGFFDVATLPAYLNGLGGRGGRIAVDCPADRLLFPPDGGNPSGRQAGERAAV